MTKLQTAYFKIR